MLDAADTLIDMSERSVSVSRVIKASPEAIFDILADPAKHSEFDGSGTVQHIRGDADRLGLDAKFSMSMKMGPLPYKVTSTVKEFEENRLIAWAHFGKHRWRYELEPTTTADGEAATNVTETFDWSFSPAPKMIELAGYPKKHPANMIATLDRLAELVES
jgi:uncharacterized protein YndB with AHSA1/START domain